VDCVGNTSVVELTRLGDAELATALTVPAAVDLRS